MAAVVEAGRDSADPVPAFGDGPRGHLEHAAGGTAADDDELSASDRSRRYVGGVWRLPAVHRNEGRRGAACAGHPGMTVAHSYFSAAALAAYHANPRGGHRYGRDSSPEVVAAERALE